MFVFPDHWEDTRVVAVYVAVVQDERDALQVSYLREPDLESDPLSTAFYSSSDALLQDVGDIYVDQGPADDMDQDGVVALDYACDVILAARRGSECDR